MAKKRDGELRTMRKSVARLRAAPYNPRDISPKALEGLRTSIREFGLVEPIIWNKRTRRVVAGHQRVEALKQEGVKSTDVIVVDLPEEREKVLNVALNNPHIMGHWTGGLAGVLDDIEGTLPELMAGLLLGDLRDDLPPLDELAGGGLTDPNATPLPPAHAKTKPGDLYILGEHRLICGDCRDAKIVQRLMKGERAVLFATDPPYLVGYDGMNHPHAWTNKDWTATYGKAHWDEAEASPDLYDKAIGVAKEHAITDRAAWYWWHASRNQAMLEAVWEKHEAFVHQQIIWVKDRPILTRCWYMWQHEPCFFGWVKGKKPRRVTRNYPYTVWQIPTTKPGVSTEHPTSKPVELFQTPIQQHTRPGDICYEPFAGSGSQFIAAEQFDRRCYGLEIEPRYCDVIVRRFEEFTGKKAKRLRAARKRAKKATK